MTEQLTAIEWDKPIFPVFPDPEWEAEVKRVTGGVADVYRRIASVPWLRNSALSLEKYHPHHISQRLIDIIALVSAQENACRYCYGVVRSQMKLLGHSESYINKLEREVQLAELNEKDRVFVSFCRSLARSSPRPAKLERQNLLDQGFTPQAVAEVVVVIAMNCFFNRVATFVASEPELKLERLADGMASYLFRAIGPVVRPMRERKARKRQSQPQKPASGMNATLFGKLIDSLEGIQATPVLVQILEDCFTSSRLPYRTKALIFAVVARTLDCDICQNEMARELLKEGMSAEKVESCLTALDLPELEPYESKILEWTRNTVHYQPSQIQKRTRHLVEAIGEETALEAIGVASLANSVIRIAMLIK